ncbi:MAG TPA: ABC transporter ATP-binding protein [Jatrophihabitans sp.]|jgi:putative ABC transport system ATP-binding protein|nr:ABC transporter ATP-binding protein [Jatrophihabitans sp.]
MTARTSGDDAGLATLTERPAVVCDNIARTFGAGSAAVVAVYGVSCTVAPGSRIALTGPSGSGKSTMLHMMAALETPSAGTISWPALNDHPQAHPGRIGVVFQGPSLLPALDVAENVALPLLLADVDEREATHRAAHALSQLGIADLADKLPEQLSGGQAQRVAVARVLAARPRLILADEPTGQLDHAAAQLVLDVLLHASRELGAALVVSTHDPLIAQRLDTRWAMRDGRIDLDPADGASA